MIINVRQLRQFLGLHIIRKLVKCRRARFIDGLIDSNKYGVVLKVMESNLYSEGFIELCVFVCLCVLLFYPCVFLSLWFIVNYCIAVLHWM